MPRLMPPQSTRLIENVTIEWGKKKKYKAIFPSPFFFFKGGKGQHVVRKPSCSIDSTYNVSFRFTVIVYYY